MNSDRKQSCVLLFLIALSNKKYCYNNAFSSSQCGLRCVCSLCNFIGQFLSIYHLHLLSLRQSASQEEGYDKVTWTSDTETHPPWLRFHLGISRWELYNRKDPNLAQLTHYLATQHIHSAGEQMSRGGQGGGMTAQCKGGGTINVVCYQNVKYADLHFVSYLGGTFITVKQPVLQAAMLNTPRFD